MAKKGRRKKKGKLSPREARAKRMLVKMLRGFKVKK